MQTGGRRVEAENDASALPPSLPPCLSPAPCSLPPSLPASPHGPSGYCCMANADRCCPHSALCVHSTNPQHSSRRTSRLGSRGVAERKWQWRLGSRLVVVRSGYCGSDMPLGGGGRGCFSGSAPWNAGEATHPPPFVDVVHTLCSQTCLEPCMTGCAPRNQTVCISMGSAQCTAIHTTRSRGHHDWEAKTIQM